MNYIRLQFKAADLLRLFLGLVFLSAGVYRMFHWQKAVVELSNLNLNYTYLPALVIALEVIGGLFLILNIKTKKVLAVLAIFLTAAILWAIIVSGESLLGKATELFTLNLTPQDLFLHLTYLVILIYLFSTSKQENH